MKKYDKVKAHEYYMKHRKLKGRKGKAKTTGGKVSQKKAKIKKRYTAPKGVALMTKSKGGKGVKMTEEQYLKTKITDLKEHLSNLTPDKKVAVKSQIMNISARFKKIKGKR